jgi:hypothetical protein
LAAIFGVKFSYVSRPSEVRAQNRFAAPAGDSTHGSASVADAQSEDSAEDGHSRAHTVEHKRNVIDNVSEKTVEFDFRFDTLGKSVREEDGSHSADGLLGDI